MASMNKAILIGYLGRDPEVKYTPNGKAVTSFSIATNESYTGKDGQKVENTDWHRIVAWDKLAEQVGEYLKKGRQVLIEGKLRTRSYEDKEHVQRYVTEVIARQVLFLGNGNGHGPKAAEKAADESLVAGTDGQSEESMGSYIPDGDVPF